MHVLFIQNVSSLLIQLEESLESINSNCRRKDKEKIFSYLIAKILFKTGRCNAIYNSLVIHDKYVQEIEKTITYFRRNKYLPSIVLNEILIPKEVRKQDEHGVHLYLKGDLLFILKD